ncbi:D-methionine transport system ATP-binding protein [Sediminihabitans luteus]|uniref:D-methionine transport system ATP-binding protein n=1 Tax=Sediminihabitans luteus TaxID=1138585 RepID=A0A2M9CEN5_9CELL|nr:methionine ABC transporter ATP-binding protein [Sediminihabitans luteus]PJJ70337.1 D-methionine transport system ATP-binding protein [Sediminihabitans luteus]GII97809.1 methionine import ATP-binding protein MetN [Sediminihabitans luteus]
MSDALTAPAADAAGARPGEPIIRFRDVTKVFRTGSEVRAVDGVTLDVLAGEVFGVIGYSGAGKSTLVRLVNALETATSGTIEVDGTTVTDLPEARLRPVRARIGMIFQQFNLLGSRTVAGNVAYPLRVAGWPRARREARVAELLEFVGIADKARSYPSRLSGGQKQRVGIARALAADPRILLADEATSALDPETTQDVLALLRRVNRELGVTVVIITHEMDVVRTTCDRVAVMEHGKVVETGDVYDVFANPRQPVTRRFVETALRDRPGPDVVARLRTRHPGRMVVVGVDEQTGSSARVTQTLRTHGVDGTIVYGGITEVASRPYGSLTFELVGDGDRIARVVAELESYTDVVDLGTAEEPRDDASSEEVVR